MLRVCESLFTLANVESYSHLRLFRGKLVRPGKLLASVWRQDIAKVNAVASRVVKDVSALDRDAFFKDGVATELFIAASAYNQRHQIGTIENRDVPELTRKQASLSTKKDLDPKDKPIALRERRFGRWELVKRYPGDLSSQAKIAKSIFRSTQKERLWSLIGRVLELFGIQVARLQKCHYRSENEVDSQIYKEASPLELGHSPTSYWLGHASLLLSVPLKGTSGNIQNFNVITDPVEGDLNKLFYPRQTRFARSVERLPAVDVYLLSHNHLDHYSESTIKKLVARQPVIIVPKGDGERFRSLGFSQVSELDWWEEQTVSFEVGSERFEMPITQVPARHWAGQGPCSGHKSTFGGYVIRSSQGDIYFAGDTARLNEQHLQKLRERFDIRWMYQPGGPDEVRSYMESSHQSSCDALWMHAEIFLRDQESWKRAKTFKTVLMHTMTFKLGNLHLNDSYRSIERVLLALDGESTRLRAYEQKVFEELSLKADSLGVSTKELASVLRETVAIPKIGSRICLDHPLEKDDLLSYP